MKTSAVLALLLIAVDADGHLKVSGSGAVVVTLLEMLSLPGSWPAFSAHQLPIQSSAPAGVHTASEAETAQNVSPEDRASLPFMAACNTLLHCLVVSQIQEDRNHAQLSAIQRTAVLLYFAMSAFAVGTCNWQSAQHTPAAVVNTKSSLPLARVMQWWRRQALVLIPSSWPFKMLVSKTLFNLFANPTMSLSRMLWLADRIRRQRQAAQHMLEDSKAVGVEEVVRGVTTAVLRVETHRHIVLGPKVQRDAYVRCFLP